MWFGVGMKSLVIRLHWKLEGHNQMWFGVCMKSLDCTGMSQSERCMTHTPGTMIGMEAQPHLTINETGCSGMRCYMNQ